MTVSDGDLTDTASLAITLSDVNDHIPVFGSSAYTFFASPWTSVGTVIGQITATDGDLGSFGKKNTFNTICYNAKLITIQYNPIGGIT